MPDTAPAATIPDPVPTAPHELAALIRAAGTDPFASGDLLLAELRKQLDDPAQVDLIWSDTMAEVEHMEAVDQATELLHLSLARAEDALNAAHATHQIPDPDDMFAEGHTTRLLTAAATAVAAAIVLDPYPAGFPPSDQLTPAEQGDFHEAVRIARHAVGGARRAFKLLSAGGAWHPDYAETTEARYAGEFLHDAARALAAVRALNPEPPATT